MDTTLPDELIHLFTFLGLEVESTPESSNVVCQMEYQKIAESCRRLNLLVKFMQSCNEFSSSCIDHGGIPCRIQGLKYTLIERLLSPPLNSYSTWFGELGFHDQRKYLDKLLEVAPEEGSTVIELVTKGPAVSWG
ncbi:hypothetical protein [Absidia glauca]|uniref:Uncharacterized protein n=1 Tax=Absidia glauca TaxID=4829 RepID=A0A163MS36_ABSGL|nr:hypothetical protein [Absidia glauca]